MDGWSWPATEAELVSVQGQLAEAAETALAGAPWTLPPDPLIGGCFVAFARGEAGPGQAGDRAWAAAVAWRPGSVPRRRDGSPYRRIDRT
ncbi:MAG TPA: hypothetical protein VGL92_00195, partial [Acidimicrobiia bacterium]